MSLVWRDQLSVGNDVIDFDHKHLIVIINQVEQCMVEKDLNGLSNAFESLTKYSQEHFAREERIARLAGYTQVPHLSNSHRDLLKYLDQLKTEIGEEWSPTAVNHFSSLLRNWLVNHVIKEDLLMKPVLLKHSSGFGQS